jgi:hypothetical protein
MVGKSDKIMVLQTHTNLKSAANSLQHIGYSAGLCLFNQLWQSGKGNRFVTKWRQK